MAWIADPDVWASLATLTVLEVVLGIDNVIFISILASRLEGARADRARFVGLSLALGMRVMLLLAISWIVRLTSPLFTIVGHELSGRDLILLGGGLFLMGKSTFEIHNKLEGDTQEGPEGPATSFARVIVQILLIDIVLSLDSVITAVGMSDRVGVMIAAVVIAVGVMLWSSGHVMRFVTKHPTVKMLALAFLMLIGLSLVAESFEYGIPKGYLYFAMAFAVAVEGLNLHTKRRRASQTEPIAFHERHMPDGSDVPERGAQADPQRDARPDSQPEPAAAEVARDLRNVG